MTGIERRTHSFLLKCAFLILARAFVAARASASSHRQPFPVVAEKSEVGMQFYSALIGGMFYIDP